MFKLRVFQIRLLPDININPKNAADVRHTCRKTFTNRNLAFDEIYYNGGDSKAFPAYMPVFLFSSN